MAFATPGQRHHQTGFPAVLCGWEWGKTAAHGQARLHCQRSKVTRHVKAPQELPSCRNVSLMCISTWLGSCLFLLVSGTVTLPSTDTSIGLRNYICDITAEAAAKAFVSTWIACFGCPQQITNGVVVVWWAPRVSPTHVAMIVYRPHNTTLQTPRQIRECSGN